MDREAKLSDGLTIFDHITPHVRKVNEDYFKFDFLKSCSEVFLTGTAVEITPVKSIDNFVFEKKSFGRYYLINCIF